MLTLRFSVLIELLQDCFKHNKKLFYLNNEKRNSEKKKVDVTGLTLPKEKSKKKTGKAPCNVWALIIV